MDCDIASYHVSSFDYLADEGLHLAALDVPPEKFRLPTGEAIEMKYNGAQLGYPSLETSSGTSSSLESMKIYPSECRQRGTTYRAPLKASIEIRSNGVPVMLMSSRCHLRGLSRSQLVAKGEEGTEKGGYFIVKGSEKVIRLLVANRRNFPIAIVRRSFKEKGKLFTQYGVMMRCIRENHSAAMITLHYLETGAITVALQVNFIVSICSGL
ncbi:unnamed protein product [Toxocara canis]|uniref:DNA-directed RNA polymerase n=1 Tax=Toxocara canis TaxID=6265 RepID=A0A183VBT3_TOXCA|nr:unnamed protein product [Toxocara canis]